jgi:hypothetical protein
VMVPVMQLNYGFCQMSATDAGIGIVFERRERVNAATFWDDPVGCCRRQLATLTFQHRSDSLRNKNPHVFRLIPSGLGRILQVGKGFCRRSSELG